MGDRDLRALAAGLARARGLVELRLEVSGCTSLTDASMEALAGVISRVDRGYLGDAGDCTEDKDGPDGPANIPDDGPDDGPANSAAGGAADAAGEAPPGLRVLHLDCRRCTRVTDSGMAILGQAVVRCAQLQEVRLDFSGTQVSERARVQQTTAAVAAALESYKE
mmetsp:Transcript_48566/g.110270  ORF Transcript_48566/g.110270 Transcript_48566/m.110270 type:complete len:165 (-) Transcript_48566:86-580(-)